MNKILYARIQRRIDEEQAIQEGLAHEGPRIIRYLLNSRRSSLRRLATDAQCSATYLSRISNEQCDISPRLYVVLCKLAQEGKK